MLQALLDEPEARAVYLFPTKALTQDQAAVLGDLLGDAASAADQIAVRTYDGDTPAAQRRAIRDEARLLLTNPDMLHAGILPHHPRWATLFENLRWIVIDELHVYRGVFGSNVANVLRRLRRLCRFYGSDPRFILTSATIANPRELAEQLIEAPVRLIPPDLDGSPRAEKHIVIYNPPVLDPALGIRRAYTLEATRIAAAFLESEVQTVVFARARRTTEILLGYLRDALQQAGGDPARIRGYRGGYLPLERRGDRARAARRLGAGRRGHQRPRAGGRHRPDGCGGRRRLPGHDRQPVAAGRARRPASGGLGGHPGRLGRAARSVRGRPPAPTSSSARRRWG